MAPKRFIDLSISIEPELPSDPPMMIPKIDYINHESDAEQILGDHAASTEEEDRGDRESEGRAHDRQQGQLLR